MHMGQAIYGAQFALEGLTPFINDVVESMTRMTNSFKDFMKESPTMLRFYDNMSEKGSTVFDSVINGLGQFGKGLVDMVNAGMPLIENVASGFENMGTKFAEWADRMAANDGFKAFTEYVNENMPKISSIFGDAFNGIINLFAAFGENSSLVLDGLVDMMERFREWSATIKESDGFQKFIDYIQTNGPTVISLIGNIVMMIVNFGIAIAPLAQKVLEVTNAFIEWLAELFKTSPIVGMVVGVITTLFGILMALAAPIIAIRTALGFLGQAFLIVVRFIKPLITGFISLMTNGRLVNAVMWILRGAMVLLSGTVGVVIGVLTALVAVFVMLYQEVEWFRNVVNSVWTFVTTFIQERVALIIETFNQFREQGQGIFEALWNTIVTIISEGLSQTWTSITTWISEILAAFLEWGAGLIESIRTTLAEFALKILTKLLEAKARFTEWITGVIESIIQFGVNLVETIRAALTEFALTIMTKLIEAKTRFTTWISETIAAIIQFGVNLVSNIRSSFTELVSTIRNKLTEAKNEVVSKFQEMVSNAKAKAQEILSNIRTKFQEIKQTIQDKITQAKNELVNKMTEMVTNARTKAQEVYQNIKDKISEMPDMVGGFISDAVTAVTDKFGEFKDAGANIVQSIADGISGAVGKVKTAIGNVTSAIRDYLPFSPAKEGALRDIMKVNISGSIAQAISDRAHEPLREIDRMTRSMSRELNQYTPELNSINSSMDKDLSSLNKRMHSTIETDIQSGIETQRPIVNVTVRNEGDLQAIRSAIQLEDGIDETLAF